ncbi:MAG: hypothetical protein ABJH20_00165 [Rhizobiaceae bacterium]
MPVLLDDPLLALWPLLPEPRGATLQTWYVGVIEAFLVGLIALLSGWFAAPSFFGKAKGT